MKPKHDIVEENIRKSLLFISHTTIEDVKVIKTPSEL